MSEPTRGGPKISNLDKMAFLGCFWDFRILLKNLFLEVLDKKHAFRKLHQQEGGPSPPRGEEMSPSIDLRSKVSDIRDTPPLAYKL